MSAKTDAISAIYAQVAAPKWAAGNLDALADVLRDLSWLPDGPVRIALPDLDGLAEDDRRAVLSVLAHAVTESIGTARPIQVREADVDQ
jgi:hypothetical protein